MFKKLAVITVMLGTAMSVPAAISVARKYMAASRYDLSEEAQAYVAVCQQHMSASLKERDHYTRYFTILHYPASIQLCSCVADQLSTSRPNDFEKANIVFVKVTKVLDGSKADLLDVVTDLGDRLGLSEAEIAELFRANNNAFKKCL
ncbi:hypothetical protein [uncultured Aliiroseovarius sp.]|uniref:hypothetical protein n=1 Tax=uncultured Aliiroseovarius sp. TaxID=1658783 RepID=UPI002599C86B|nr:hypothetical protein [uncultured Aliiroseovarius sp.]